VSVERTAASTFSPTLEASSEARRFVRGTLAAWGREVAIEPAQLLVSELVTNAVVHGGHGVVIVRLLVDEPWLRIEVSDANAREYPQLKVPHDNGARGLHIVDAVASAWGCSPVGQRKTVWCEVPLVASASRTTG
jgi:anti-sigma regulatory factor (Ser/Thr protein kinase)